LEKEAHPDGIIVGDEHLLRAVADALRARRLAPGRDVAVIALGNKGEERPASANWSTLELDREAFGATVANHCLQSVTDASHQPVDLVIRRRWIEGQTHQRSR